MPVFPVIAMKRFDFKNSLIAIKVYIMILIKMMKDCESLTVISVEYYCKDHTSWFEMINRLKRSLEI